MIYQAGRVLFDELAEESTFTKARLLPASRIDPILERR